MKTFNTRSTSTKTLAATILFSSLYAGVVDAKTYMVHLRSPSTFHQIYDNFKSMVQTQGIRRRDMFGNRTLDLPVLLNSKAKTLDALDRLNMVIIEASDYDVELLKQNKEVNFIEEDFIIPAPRAPMSVNTADTNTHNDAAGLPNDGEKPWGISAVHAPGAWAQGIKGQGVKVMVLDTGIDRDHPDLKDRFEEGKNFVPRRPGPEPVNVGNTLFSNLSGISAVEPFVDVPYEYFDLNGHGTHVSGTIAGNENNQGVVGVAPQARLLMGRVCGKFGCTGSAIVNGLNWAVSKGVDVVSMSLGGPLNSRAQQEAVDAVERANIVVVAASGNDGTEKISFPAASPSVIAVGAVDSGIARASFSQFGPELDVVAPGVDVQSSVPQGSGRAASVKINSNGAQLEIPSTSFLGSPTTAAEVTGNLAFVGLGKAADFNAGNVRGKIALIQRGEIPFSEKVENAIRAGASGAVIYNNVDGLMSGALTEDGSEVSIPVVMIEKVHGESLATALQAGGVEAVKVNIFKTNYSSFSGTSMATPHVAGVVALIRSANHGLSAARVRELLKSSAQAIPNPTGHNEYGAGLVNADAAVRAAHQ